MANITNRFVSIPGLTGVIVRLPNGKVAKLATPKVEEKSNSKES